MKVHNAAQQCIREGNEVVRDFVAQALTHELDVDIYELIWSMGVLISDNPRAVDVSKNIEKIITDPRCKKVMEKAGKELKDKK